MNNHIKKSNDLIFITEFFPYGKGEAFIENEIETLAEHFNRVFILTTTKLDEPARKCPKNTTLISMERKMKYLEILPALFSILFWNELKNCMLNIRKIWFALSFLGKSILIKKYINEINSTYKIDPNKLSIYSYWFTEGACAVAMLRNIKRKVARAHRFDLYDYCNVYNYQPFQKQILDNIDNVLPCSLNGTEYLQNKFPIIKNKIKTSYLGTKQHSTKTLIKNHFFTIVSCSAITVSKRVDLIINGISKFKESYNLEIKWIHIGSGEEEKRIKKIAKKKLFAIEYYFLGELTNQNVIDFYNTNRVDVFINLSSSEGLPVSMMEAQSFGIPIIATNVGGVSEIINNQTGILIRDNPSNEEISNAIYKLHSMPLEDINSLRLNCIKHWKNKFNAHSNYVEFIENYLY